MHKAQVKGTNVKAVTLTKLYFCWYCLFCRGRVGVAVISYLVKSAVLPEQAISSSPPRTAVLLEEVGIAASADCS